MVKTRLLVVGAGGHGRSEAEAAELSGQFEVVGFLDDALPAGKSVLNVALQTCTASAGGRIVFQMDKATPAHQDVLWHQRERGQDANLDCGIALSRP